MEPSSLTQNRTAIWDQSVALSLPDGRTVGSAAVGWVLKYSLRGPITVALTASSNGAAHRVTLSAAVTADYTAGEYQWNSWVELGSEKFPVGSGSLTIYVDPATAGVYDGRTHAAKMLAAIEAMLLDTASREEKSYTINAPGGGGRIIEFTPRADLIQFRNFYVIERDREIAAERLAAGLGSRGKVRMRFVTPG